MSIKVNSWILSGLSVGLKVVSGLRSEETDSAYLVHLSIVLTWLSDCESIQLFAVGWGLGCLGVVGVVLSLCLKQSDAVQHLAFECMAFVEYKWKEQRFIITSQNHHWEPSTLRNPASTRRYIDTNYNWSLFPRHAGGFPPTGGNLRSHHHYVAYWMKKNYNIVPYPPDSQEFPQTPSSNRFYSECHFTSLPVYSLLSSS